MIWQLHCYPTLPSLCWQINSYQPPSGYLSITRSASGGSERDLRRQQAQGVPKACKKAGFAPTGAVCRSCTTMPVSTGAFPPGGKTVPVFPALKYSAPAPCRSGCRGEAPWSPKAKSRFVALKSVFCQNSVKAVATRFPRVTLSADRFENQNNGGTHEQIFRFTGLYGTGRSRIGLRRRLY